MDAWAVRPVPGRATKQMFPRAEVVDVGKIQISVILMAALFFGLISLTGGEASSYVLDFVPGWVAV